MCAMESLELGILSLLDEIPFSLPKSRETKDVGFFNGFHLGENGPHASSHGHVQDTPRDNE